MDAKYIKIIHFMSIWMDPPPPNGEAIIFCVTWIFSPVIELPISMEYLIKYSALHLLSLYLKGNIY